MDYEKKYNEALERARQFSEHPLQEDSSNIVEYIFPELQESKDERVRKGLVKAVSGTFEGSKLYGSDVTREEALAWLEKQGNTIPDECVFRPVAGCDIESAAKQAIKQQGVLAKEIVLAFNGAYIPVVGKAADIIVNEYNSWLEKQGEQKSVWSEEDENILEDIKEAVINTWCGDTQDIILDWLKSLKQRIGGKV